jgi:hypothetical protein
VGIHTGTSQQSPELLKDKGNLGCWGFFPCLEGQPLVIILGAANAHTLAQNSMGIVAQ